jgi:hypothetical protein
LFDAKDYMCSDISLDAIRSGTARAIQKHGIGNTVRNPAMASSRKLSILLEEVGEIANVLNEYALGNIDEEQCRMKLVKELVDVGAVVALWMDAEEDPS